MLKLLKKILGYVLGGVLCVIVVAMLLALFLGCPVSAVIETIDMSLMSKSVPATIRSVGWVNGGEGSRPVVEYTYTVDGVSYTSHRFAPGFFANSGTWTGGGVGIEKHFKAGQIVTIHYQPRRPWHACLEFGWFKWSIGFSLAVWGGIVWQFKRPKRASDVQKTMSSQQHVDVRGIGLQPMSGGNVPLANDTSATDQFHPEQRNSFANDGEPSAGSRCNSGRKWRMILGAAMAYSGVLLIFVGPDIIPADKADQYVLGFFGMILLCALYHAFKTWRHNRGKIIKLEPAFM